MNKKYIIYFSKLYTGIILLYAAASTLLEMYFEIKLSGSVSLLITMICASGTGEKFIKDTGRLPSVDERKSLTRKSFVSSLIISLVLAYVFLVIFGGADEFMQELNGIGVTPIVIILSVTFALHYLLLKIGYGFLLTKSISARKLNKETSNG